MAGLYRAFRERDPGGADDPAAEAVALVERTVQPLDALQAAFDSWFAAVRGRDDTNQPGTVGKTLPGGGN